MASQGTDGRTLGRIACAATIVRGLLAEPSGSEDDPFRRVLLNCFAASAASKTKRGKEAPALVVDLAVDAAHEDGVRAGLKSAIEKYSAVHGVRPRVVMFGRTGGARIAELSSGHESFQLENKVALVTGAGGAIGAGICRGLLAKGCRVAATDVVGAGLDSLADEVGAAAGDRLHTLLLDVTDKDSVADGFAQVAWKWGGIDIVIVNAGIAMVASLVDMEPESFRKLEKVNVEGTLLTIAEAGRWMKRQGTGGDIVLVSTKNVFAPGAQFGAYSATKAASHQLARIASLEFAPFGVRVNMVSPDAVFNDGSRKSGLWAEVGPSRMKARGLDEKGLEEYYRNRNLLKARVTATHVANAVLFFVTRQTPTTGATIPIDGGLPDAAPR
jgi:NAD(P)-dependent dehydrogenase (short-subunit alcohol dehydrogenase family)